MPRQARIVAEGLLHHVVHRGIDRQPIYRFDGDREAFLARVSRAAQRHGVEILAYCLMDNHYHLLVRDVRGELSPFMALINGAYTLWFNLKHSRDGALLRGRYFSEPTDDARYALCVLRYIHLNLVAAKMVREPGHYAWSSHRHYIRACRCLSVQSAYMEDLLRAVGVPLKDFDAWVGTPLAEYTYQANKVSGSAVESSGFLGQACVEPKLPVGVEHADAADIVMSRSERCRHMVKKIAGQYGLLYEQLCTPSREHKDIRTVARYVAAYRCYMDLGANSGEIAIALKIAQASVGVFVRRGERATAGKTQS